MADIIVILIVAAMIGGAIRYIIKSKKKGVKCIGCPDSCACSHRECPSKSHDDK